MIGVDIDSLYKVFQGVSLFSLNPYSPAPLFTLYPHSRNNISVEDVEEEIEAQSDYLSVGLSFGGSEEERGGGSCNFGHAECMK